MKDHKKLKNGSYTVLVSVLTVAVLVIINLIVRALPVSMTQLDMSRDGLYSLTQTTKDTVSALEKDITIYLIASEGNEDSTLVNLLDRYEDLSDHLHVETVDPVQSPTFVSQYTSDSVSENSMIVTDGETSRVVSYSDLYEYSYSDYYTYQVSGFDGEGQLTSAIAYLNSDDRSKIYTLEGHSESELSDAMTDQITKNNLDIETLNLIQTVEIPEDASAILINCPQKDLTDAETELLTEYVNNGGNLYLIISYMTEEHPNLDSILALYSVELEDGIIVEGDSSMYYPGYPTYLFPNISSSDLTSDMLSSGEFVLLPVSQGIVFNGEDDAELTYDTILSTSSDAYSKADVTSQTIEKEEGDIDGPFDVAATIEKDDGETASKLFLCTSAGFTDETVNEVVAGGNAALFANGVTWMVGESDNTAVAVKSISNNTLTLTSAQLNLWVSVVIIIIPAAILITGIVVCVRRRKKR